MIYDKEMWSGQWCGVDSSRSEVALKLSIRRELLLQIGRDLLGLGQLTL